MRFQKWLSFLILASAFCVTAQSKIEPLGLQPFSIKSISISKTKAEPAPILVAASEVELTIYNARGQKIQTLVNGRQSAGEHSIRFKITPLPSGIYFYKLTTRAGFIQTRKMLLLR